MLKKLKVWGPVSSIISLLLVLLIPQVSISDNQTSYGDNSPNIKTESGDVIVYPPSKSNT